jgi:cytochrome c-type biogenesis protein
MGQLFTTVNQWLAGSLLVASFGSLVWGILSIILSPCHLAAIPLVIGYISSQKDQTTKKAFISSLLLSLGILASIILLGAITLSLGRIAGDLGPITNYVVAAVLIFFGLYLTGLIKLNWGGGLPVKGMKKTTNPWATFILGFIVGAGLGPCTFAFMAPIMGIAFQVASTNLIHAILILSFFAIGHVGVIVLAGTFTGAVQTYLNWTEKSKGATILKIICGILVIIAGFYMIWKELV